MANQNTSVSLSDHFVEFTAKQVEAGRFGSTSEVIRAGLRMLELEQNKLEALRQALIKGEESGIASPWDLEQFLRDRRAEDRNAA